MVSQQPVRASRGALARDGPNVEHDEDVVDQHRYAHCIVYAKRKRLMKYQEKTNIHTQYTTHLKHCCVEALVIAHMTNTTSRFNENQIQTLQGVRGTMTA